MKKRYYIMAALIIIAAISLSGCKKKAEMDLSGIHTTAAETTPAETMAEETKKDPEATKAPAEESKPNSAEALSVRSQIATYKEGKISIEYPILSNLRNSDTEEQINSLIKEQAVKLVSARELDSEKDSVSVKCDIITLDRNRAVLCFKGELSADGSDHPQSLYYTMSVDLAKGSLQKLSDYADPYTMAGYILSDDCVISEASDKEAVKEYLKTQELNSVWELLKKCDFSAEEPTFPETFSYVNNGIIYISIPAPHTLGDYFIIEYHSETK